MSESLRSRSVRLAASMPEGSRERKALTELLAATPDWPGADAVYSYLYTVLERMGAENWKAEVSRAKKRRTRPKAPRPSEEMEDIMRLNMGDADRRIRAFVIAPILLVVVWLVGFGTVGGVIAVILAAVMLGTAAVGTSPLCLPFHVHTGHHSTS